MDLIQQPGNQLTEFTREQIELIKVQIAKGCTDDELKLFIEICKQSNLNPFTRQIYAIKRRTRDGEQMTIQCSIDGYRAIAHRTGKCLSISDPKFEYKGDNINIPFSATITIEKIVGQHIGKFTATAYWSDYYGDGKSYMANSKPRIMLGKACEALALRKAFPAELSGLYTKEEMHIADVEEMKTVQDVAITEKVTDIETNRVDFDAKVEFIAAQVKILWPKLDDEKRKHLFSNILKVKGVGELNRKTYQEVKEIHSVLCNYIDDLSENKNVE